MTRESDDLVQCSLYTRAEDESLDPLLLCIII